MALGATSGDGPNPFDVAGVSPLVAVPANEGTCGCWVSVCSPEGSGAHIYCQSKRGHDGQHGAHLEIHGKPIVLRWEPWTKRAPRSRLTRMRIAMRIFGTLMMGVAGGAFIYQAIAADGMSIGERIALGSVVGVVSGAGLLAIWAPRWLQRRFNK